MGYLLDMRSAIARAVESGSIYHGQQMAWCRECPPRWNRACDSCMRRQWDDDPWAGEGNTAPVGDPAWGDPVLSPPARGDPMQRQQRHEQRMYVPAIDARYGLGRPQVEEMARNLVGTRHNIVPIEEDQQEDEAMWEEVNRITDPNVLSDPRSDNRPRSNRRGGYSDWNR